MQETMRRKYSCDRSITVTRLEDLLQDAAVKPTTLTAFCGKPSQPLLTDDFLRQDEKEQLNDFKAGLEGLKQRAKSIIQLKPRNPATAIRSKLPIQAVCDFKQMEVSHTCSAPSITFLFLKINIYIYHLTNCINAFLHFPADHGAPRRRMCSAEQLAALQVEGAERQGQRVHGAVHLLPGVSHQQGCGEQRGRVRRELPERMSRFSLQGGGGGGVS